LRLLHCQGKILWDKNAARHLCHSLKHILVLFGWSRNREYIRKNLRGDWKFCLHIYVCIYSCEGLKGYEFRNIKHSRIKKIQILTDRRSTPSGPKVGTFLAKLWDSQCGYTCQSRREVTPGHCSSVGVPNILEGSIISKQHSWINKQSMKTQIKMWLASNIPVTTKKRFSDILEYVN